MMRAGLAGLLVLVLGAGAAAQSPSPQAEVAAGEAGDLGVGRFVPAGSLAEPRIGHTATLLADGRVLVVGGQGEAQTEPSYEPGQPLASAEVWHPATEKFAPADTMADARYGHTATALPDGRVVVVGGYGEGEWPNVLASAEVWDPVTGVFAPTGSLSEARAEHTASLLPNGQVLVIGGVGSEDTPQSAEAWDPATGEFAIVGFLAKPRHGHAAAPQSDGRILVIGGERPWWDDKPEEERKVVEVWDPTAFNGFGRAGIWGDARLYRTITPLADGRVLTAGGWADEDGPTDTRGLPTEVRVWDPATAQSKAAGSLIEFRTAHTATLLPDGRVLVIGGGLVTFDVDANFLLASAEVWDPLTQESRPAGSLAAPRLLHTATALSDGRVLVVGGLQGSDVTAEAEVWESSGMDGAPTADPATARPEAAAGETVQATTTGEVETGALPTGRRVERAEDGFAMAFPLDWHVEVRDKSESREGDPEGAEYRLVLLGWRAPLDEEWCGVWDLTSVARTPPQWATLDDAAAWVAAPKQGDVESPIYATYPAGPVVTIEEKTEDGWSGVSTVLTESDDWFLVMCSSKDPPEDRWLPIVASFEFLPEEGG